MVPETETPGERASGVAGRKIFDRETKPLKCPAPSVTVLKACCRLPRVIAWTQPAYRAALCRLVPIWSDASIAYVSFCTFWGLRKLS